MSEVVIRVDNVKKSYRRYKTNWQKVKHLLFMQDSGRKWRVLKGVSFEVERGEKVGIIGTHFSGRTTLMKLIAGMIEPDSGELEVNGEVTAVIDHKTGFQTIMSGLDNYKVRARIRGWSAKDIEEREEEVFEFAGLTKEKAYPLRQYRKGWINRLGFAVDTEMEPDIFLYDEGFAFGSKTFTEKALRRLRKISDSDTTFIMTVSQREYAEELCERGIVIDKGKVVYDGPFDKAMKFFDKNVRTTAKVESDKEKKED